MAKKPINVYTQMPELVKIFKSQNPDNPLYRIYVDPVLTEASLTAANSRDPNDYLFIRSYLVGGTGVDYDLYCSQNVLSFNEGGWKYVLDPWMASLKGPLKQRLLELWNVKYIIDFAVNEQRQWSFTVRVNPNPAPRAWLSYAQYPMATLQDVLRQMQISSFNPREMILTVEPDAKVGVSKVAGTPGTKDVDSIHYTNNTVTITATAEHDAWLYISDTYEKGWRAYVDGRRTPVFRANMNGRAIAFPAGTHTILFRYSPASFWIGLWVGAIAWLAVIIWIVIMFRKKTK